MIVLSSTPRLDLHGEQTAFVEFLVNSFIYENVLQNINVVAIIHGKSTNVLTKETHKVLKKNKYV
jgi:Mismatch repair ATPase (MutS family)